MRPRLVLLLFVAPALSCAGHAPKAIGPTWSGMTFRYEPEARGIRVLDVMTAAPAHKAGLRRGDLITKVDGAPIDPDRPLLPFVELMNGGPPGRRVAVRFVRGEAPGSATLVLEPKMETLPLSTRFEIPVRSPSKDSLEAFARALGAEIPSVAPDDAAVRADVYRREPLLRVLASPFTLAEASIASASEPAPEPPRVIRGAKAVDYLDAFERLFEEASLHWRRAIEGLAPDEIEFLRDHLAALGQALIEAPHLQSDRDEARLARNIRWLRLSTQVKIEGILAAGRTLASVRVEGLREAWTAEGRAAEDVVGRGTAFGPMVIAGPGSHRFRRDAALIIDLGGDDTYLNNAGGSRDMPFSVVIDLGGNDAYESTSNVAQGCGMLGVGILRDLGGGDDSYAAQQWAQGATALGFGLLQDDGGADRYRAQEFAQGCALIGVATLSEGGGADRYHASRFAQGLGLPGGIGSLRDTGGDDEYYCKGRYRTSFGDEGIFEGWGQGCGAGIRGAASGGVGLLVDGGGRDRYEAGNFSQGAGYYFGWGILLDENGDDRYVGSRYTQGAAAHAAAGYLEDRDGADVYEVRHGGSQGAAWDQSVAALVDRGGGDDTYRGGQFLSQGAAAQSAMAWLYDHGGADSYDRPPGRAGSNEYHDRPSLALFIDAGGGRDRYPENHPNDAILRFNGIGFFADLPGGPDPAVVPQLRR